MKEENLEEVKAGELDFFCGILDDPKNPAQGGCGKAVNILEAYRCGDCTAYFHRGCLRKHFGQESVKEVREALKMDTWQPELESLAQKGKERHVVGLVFTLLEEQRKTLTATHLEKK